MKNRMIWDDLAEVLLGLGRTDACRVMRMMELQERRVKGVKEVCG